MNWNYHTLNGLIYRVSVLNYIELYIPLLDFGHDWVPCTGFMTEDIRNSKKLSESEVFELLL